MKRHISHSSANDRRNSRNADWTLFNHCRGIDHVTMEFSPALKMIHRFSAPTRRKSRNVMKRKLEAQEEDTFVFFQEDVLEENKLGYFSRRQNLQYFTKYRL